MHHQEKKMGIQVVQVVHVPAMMIHSDDKKEHM
jgi:hypothetical protein